MDLDRLESLAAADPSGMLLAVESWPEQWDEGVRRARAVPDGELPSAEDVENVVVCGMGGSGIAGDVLRSVAANDLGVPVVVVRGSCLPAFVGSRSLLFCVSYSGDTEETLSCFQDASDRAVRMVVISSGGKLSERAERAGIPRISPLEGLQPRAALPSMSLAAPIVLERLGFLPSLEDDLAGARDAVARGVSAWRREVLAAANAAKQLAADLEGLTPVVWGSEGVLEVAARRWNTQFNENSKIPAASSCLPELAHNEVVGYETGHPSLARVAVIALEDAGEDLRTAARRRAAREVVEPHVPLVRRVPISGPSPLARLAVACLLGDFVSVYLAVGRGIDPTPVESIRRLKAALAAEPSTTAP